MKWIPWAYPREGHDIRRGGYGVCVLKKLIPCSLTLFQSHTPYVSFKMQRSLYDSTDESLLISPRSRDRSLLSAGWKWQVQRDLSLQAEASYGLGEESGSSLEPDSLERSRILFGTRWGFK